MNINKEQFKKNLKKVKKALKKCNEGVLLIAPRASGKTEIVKELIKKKLSKENENLINHFSRYPFIIMNRLGDESSKINIIGTLKPANWTFVEDVSNSDIATCKEILELNGKKVFLLTPSDNNEELIKMLSMHLDVLRFDYTSAILPYPNDVAEKDWERVRTAQILLNQKFALLSNEIDKLPKLK